MENDVLNRNIDALAAWGEMMDTIFSLENRRKFEWCVGSVLDGGPKKILLIEGQAVSGKSTAINFASEIFKQAGTDSPYPVYYRHDGLIRGDEKLSGFVMSSYLPGDRRIQIVTQKAGSRLIHAHTTGDKLPLKRYRLLSGQIDAGLSILARYCLDIHREFGADYYDTISRGNR